jgi:hypothetical protein
METFIVMAAALVTGLFAGCLLMVTYTAAAISRSQQRMQRRVRYWQAETALAREVADRLARQLPDTDRWPTPASRTQNIEEGLR